MTMVHVRYSKTFDSLISLSINHTPDTTKQKVGQKILLTSLSLIVSQHTIFMDIRKGVCCLLPSWNNPLNYLMRRLNFNSKKMAFYTVLGLGCVNISKTYLCPKEKLCLSEKKLIYEVEKNRCAQNEVNRCRVFLAQKFQSVRLPLRKY